VKVKVNLSLLKPLTHIQGVRYRLHVFLNPAIEERSGQLHALEKNPLVPTEQGDLTHEPPLFLAKDYFRHCVLVCGTQEGK
jgi:hypothetical protein